MRKYFSILFLFSLFSLICFCHTNVVFAQNARIEFFNPQGTVYPVNQAVARFSTIMVPLSEQTTESPFNIDCAYQGKGRWTDQQTWVYDFTNPLPGGVPCTFTLKPSIKDYNGKLISGKKKFTFSTGGPVIVDSFPYSGSYSIAEDQIFLLLLSAAVSKDSLKNNAYFTVGGLPEQIALSIVESNVIESIFKKSDTYGVERLKDREKEINGKIVGVKARLNFPGNSKVNLVWDKGITSESGIRTEHTQILSFKSRKAFLAEMICTTSKATTGCLPVTPIYVDFTAPILKKDAQEIKLVYKDKVYTPVIGSDEEWVYSISFDPPFEAKTVLELTIPEYLKDIDGRPLSNAVRFPLKIEIDESPPLAKFNSYFGIIEANTGGVLPLTVRNIVNENNLIGETKESKNILEGKIDHIKPTMTNYAEVEDEDIMNYLRILKRAAWDEYETRKTPVLNDEANNNYKSFNIPISDERNSTEVIGIPLKEKGFYVVEIKSEVLGKTLLDNATDLYVRTAALVTNMTAHFKKGGESSLVWVTTLDKAEPVKKATVWVRDCSGKLIWTGKTNRDGVALINKVLKEPDQCEDGLDSFFVTARKDDDLTFVMSDWNNGIEPWRFNVASDFYNTDVAAHTIFDRTLFKPGETVHMKHILRQKTGKGFDYIKNNIPSKVVINFSDDDIATIPVSFDKNGSAVCEWKIPEEAKLGSYYVSLINGRNEYHYSGSFRVEAFKVPIMKAAIEIPEKPLIAAKEVDLSVFVQYLSGGPAVGLPVNIGWKVSPKYINFADYEDFVFGAGIVKQGIVKSEETQLEMTAQKMPLTLDETGSARVTLSNIPYSRKAQNVDIELEYMDPNGEIQSISSKVNWWASDTVIGIKRDSWVSSPSKVKFTVAAVNINGKPKKDTPVKVDFLQRKVLSHRKRLVGGFYSYEHSEEVTYLGKACEGVTDEKGYLHCESESPSSGNIILQAQSGSSATNTEIWVTGESDWWFKAENDDRMDLLPEKKRYEPGDKARFQVRMPFEKASVLITTEREGILKYFIKKLSRRNPVFEISVDGSYSPNVYVSALAVRGRITDIKPTATIDLGKPAFKLGVAEIKVGFQTHELKVKVIPEKDVYKVRDHAKAKIKVSSADGKILPEGAVVSLSVVDEGLLQIYPNDSWNILDAMMGERGLNVSTASASMYVVGKRHFGKKASPPGGGGGFSGARQIFDTLLLWNPNIVLDKNGEAEVEIPLNDSLTSFTIAAIAISNTDKFGKGTSSIRTSQDVMLFSGLPVVVREGDQFAAHFIVRNGVEKTVNIKLNFNVEGERKSGEVFKQQLSPDILSINGFNSAITNKYFKVPADVNKINWWVKAINETGNIVDSLKVTQKVIPVHLQRVWQQSLVKVDNTLKTPVSEPAKAETHRSLIKVDLSKSLGGNIESVREYMDYYPYNCLEQLVSVAVVKNSDTLWHSLTNKMTNYFDSYGLLKYFPGMMYGSDVLTSYILTISYEAGLNLPSYVIDRALNGLSDFVEGKINIPSLIGAPDYMLRKLSAIMALLKYNAAKPEMMDSLNINPVLLPTSGLLDYIEIIKVIKIKNQDKLLKQSLNILKSRLYYTGTRLGFTREKDDSLYYLMVSPDVNVARLLLMGLNTVSFKDDAGKIARGFIERQRFGHFDTTVANAWAAVAFMRFRSYYEKSPITGSTVVDLAGDKKSVNWNKSPDGGSLQFKVENEGMLNLLHIGNGAPWATISSIAAIPVIEPLYAGISIEKTIMPISQRQANTYHVGDIIRVTLHINTKSNIAWLVVNDPVPAGATILGGLKRSILEERQELSEGYYLPDYEERDFDAYRAYYSYVPEGKFDVYYDVRFNQDGIFTLPSTRVEGLYSPEIFGEIPGRTINIKP